MMALASQAEGSEYADMGAQVVETVAQMTAPRREGVRRALRRVRDWVRSRYGLREIIFPEKYFVERRHDVVVTYSSCLALVYFADDERRLDLAAIASNRRRAQVYVALLEHAGIGLVATMSGTDVHLESRTGRALIVGERLEVLSGANPLEPYGTEPYTIRAVAELVRQPNSGDMVLFGTYDGYDIVCFDDQVGAHGSAGGDQVYPFLITPRAWAIEDETIENARDIHRVIMQRPARASKSPSAAPEV
jgi:hypothetical protein